MASKQLETAIRALEQCIEVLKKHTDSGGMMDELDLIRKQMSEGRRADASVRLIALEQRVAHAQLFAPSGGLEHVFGESEQLVGGRVIEYVPSANGPPISLEALKKVVTRHNKGRCTLPFAALRSTVWSRGP
jgi:hypothetical protein